MTAYTAFLPRVMAGASGVPREIAIDAISDAVIRFCTDSQIYQYTNPKVDSDTLTDTYTVTPSALSGVRVVSPVYVEYNKNPIKPKTSEWLDMFDPSWRNADPGVPTYYIVETVGTIRFNRVPDEVITDAILTKVALKPTREATEVDEIVYQDWQEAIEHGALEHLLSMPGRAWENQDKAQEQGRGFIFHVQRAKARARKGHTNTDTTAKMRQWI